MKSIIIEYKNRNLDEHKKEQIKSFLINVDELMKGDEFAKENLSKNGRDNFSVHFRRIIININPEHYLGSPCYNLEKEKERNLTREFDRIADEIKNLVFITGMLNHEIYVTYE